MSDGSASLLQDLLLLQSQKSKSVFLSNWPLFRNIYYGLITDRYVKHSICWTWIPSPRGPFHHRPVLLCRSWAFWLSSGLRKSELIDQQLSRVANPTHETSAGSSRRPPLSSVTVTWRPVVVREERPVYPVRLTRLVSWMLRLTSLIAMLLWSNLRWPGVDHMFVKQQLWCYFMVVWLFWKVACVWGCFRRPNSEIQCGW